MLIRRFASVLLLCLGCFAADLSLWYRQPAGQWEEALPVGNGRLGAMVFGGISHERVQFNEHTVWTGAPHDYAHRGAYRYLPTIRQMLFEGRQKEAEDLAMEQFMSVPLHQRAYQAFGDVLIDFPGLEDGGATAYRRELNLDTGIASVEYTSNGVRYRREVFASHPAKVIIIRITASKPASLDFTANLHSAHEGARIRVTGDEISMTGSPADSAIRFEARLLALHSGGKRLASPEGGVAIQAADSATLILSGATNFKTYTDVSGDPVRHNTEILGALKGRSFDAMRSEHIADHQQMFRRVALDLGGAAAAEQPTDERIERFAANGDPALIALLFQYGRYLLIASSREDGQPANLQGIWNASNEPAWDSKYTVNINTEMNYWPAEPTGLSECHTALFNALKEVAASGARTAKEHYNASGWVLHHNFDLWRGTAPINASNHGIWPTGGAWLATHLWEHYLFTGDSRFLRDTAYPLMKGAALFFADYLVPDPKTGRLISGPSNSPEQGGLVMGPTMDHQIVRALFADVIAASRVLGIDAVFRTRLEKMRSKIAPNHIGRYGQLQEWLEDKDDPGNQHRHVSHLWGVFPGNEITPYGTPDLFAAARKSLEFRGDAATGWSMGWKLNLWARFLDGDHAYRILQNLITPASAKRAGLYANMFDAHPPFQIDGNFGATSGIAEMLVQSQDPYAKPEILSPVQNGQAAFIHLLPALPSALPTGRVEGIRTRGGIEVSMSWRNGKLEWAILKSSGNTPATVRYAGKENTVKFQAGRTYRVGPDLKIRLD